MLGKIDGRRRGHQKIRWLDGITDAIEMNLGNLWEMVRDRDAGIAAFLQKLPPFENTLNQMCICL